MYTLRKIANGIQSNINVGNEYSLVERDANPESFKETYLINFGKMHVADLDPESDSFSKNCYAFIVTEGGGQFIPLYLNQFAYIMTDSGKTFANLTYK